MKVCTAITGQCEARVRGSPLRASASGIAFPRHFSMPPPRRICAAFSTRASQLGIKSACQSLLAKLPAPLPPNLLTPPRSMHNGLGINEIKLCLHGRASFDSHADGTGVAPQYSCSSTDDSGLLVRAECLWPLRSVWQCYP